MDMRYGSHVREAIRDFKPDIVHVNELWMLHAASVGKAAGLPVVMHARIVPDPGNRWLLAFTWRLINRCVDCTIAIDGSVRNSLVGVRKCEIVNRPLLTGA